MYLYVWECVYMSSRGKKYIEDASDYFLQVVVSEFI